MPSRVSIFKANLRKSPVAKAQLAAIHGWIALFTNSLLAESCFLVVVMHSLIVYVWRLLEWESEYQLDHSCLFLGDQEFIVYI